MCSGGGCGMDLRAVSKRKLRLLTTGGTEAKKRKKRKKIARLATLMTY